MPSVVVDANVLVSAALKPGSIPAVILRKLISERRLVMSPAAFSEIAEVLRRPRLVRRIGSVEVTDFLDSLAAAAIFISPLAEVSASRDPKDDIYLSLALAAGAEIIVTGDQDLLSLHPYRSVDILSPTEYLERTGS
jgi:uncharacterized protein